MTKAVVLDVDGTLMDTNYLHLDAWDRALEEAGCPAAMVEIHRQVGKGSDKLIAEFTSDEKTAQKVNELHSEYYSKLQERGRPLPGAKDLISTLSERNYQVWFATSAKPEELEHHMEQLEAEGRITGIVNSSDVENTKPAPDIFELALKKANCAPEEAVALGDSVWDVESAKSAGIRTVAVRTGGAFSIQELKEAGAVEVYRGCVELLESSFPE